MLEQPGTLTKRFPNGSERAGCIKSIKITEDGEEQITGFYLPGEIVGIDGLSENYFSTSSIALEISAICEIPFHKLEELSYSIPSLQRHLFQIMSKEIIADQELIMLLSKSSARTTSGPVYTV
ncbi:MAG: hypothetical protein P8Y45_13475 [Exilibacterium sp.]